MFGHLKQHPYILVTGPQRSGTRIAAKMIAHDTGHQYVDESSVGYRDVEKIYELIERDRPTVIHGPGFSHIAHVLPVYPVFVRRAIDEIVASEKRIDWGWKARAREISNYKDFTPPVITGSSVLPICEIKYMYWDIVQKPKLLAKNKPYMQLAYSDLVRHPMWIPADQRKDFAPDQTEYSPVSSHRAIADGS